MFKYQIVKTITLLLGCYVALQQRSIDSHSLPSFNGVSHGNQMATIGHPKHSSLSHSEIYQLFVFILAAPSGIEFDRWANCQNLTVFTTRALSHRIASLFLPYISHL